MLTLDRWIRDRARSTPHRVAIDFAGAETTYAELDERSERLAAGLLEAGLARGDRVATLTGTSPEHVVVFFACAKAGLVLMPLNTRLAEPELRFQLDDAEPAVLLHSPEWAEAARALTERHAGMEELVSDRHKVPPPPADDDGLLLVYTSGTTGTPKGALLTHANCFWTNVSFDRVAGVAGEDTVLQVLPQFHVGGWNVQPLLAWWKGATVVLEPAFEPGRALELIAEKRVTTMMGVPANYLFMAQEPGFAAADLWSLRRAVVGGAPMPEAVRDAWRARGVEIVEGYGLTEAAPNVLIAGKPYPYVDVALRDPESGAFLDGAAEGELVVQGPNVFAGYWRNSEATAAAFADGWLLTGDVAAAAEGELVVQGPNVFAGYWRNSEATAAAFADGWLLTGDVAARDEDGSYRIVGRTKDMVISGGENVYPAEVENVLHDHPAVREAAVVGIPDERWGEACLAVVVLHGAASEEELLEHCRARLARYKVPKAVRFAAELPRNSLGKVAKAELLEKVS